jgi:cell fate regulator YaaT (PSP1 superfamily)
MDESRSYVTEACFGALKDHEMFRTGDATLRRGERLILRTDRGVEVGVATEDAKPGTEAPGGEVLRRFAADDQARLADLERRARGDDASYCEERIRERELPMRLVHVEHLFGGGKIIFYFVADGRVDFRELVKDLARHFRTRIELRQIGVRDEAKILGDREFCGRELCCLAWMREILPVTMRMAKNQKSTLDPNKISGRCGRLKCCLRFEDEVYSELRAKMPKVGKRVMTEQGPGKVLALDTLARTVTVQLSGSERLCCPCDRVQLASAEPPPQAEPSEE